jgi:hypothetical protein
MTLLPQGGKPDKEYPFYFERPTSAAGDDKDEKSISPLLRH